MHRRNARCACIGAALSAAFLLISQEHEKQGDSTDDVDKRHQDQPDRKFQVIQTADTIKKSKRKQFRQKKDNFFSLNAMFQQQKAGKFEKKNTEQQ